MCFFIFLKNPQLFIGRQQQSNSIIQLNWNKVELYEVTITHRFYPSDDYHAIDTLQFHRPLDMNIDVRQPCNIGTS